MIEFKSFPKIPRLFRDCVITEKLDGTNAQIYIEYSPNPGGIYAWWDGVGMFTNIYAGSRNRWITPENDNYGFASWVVSQGEQLVKLGPGHHYGEWWGNGIQRGYGLKEKRFSMFNVARWRASCSESGDLTDLLSVHGLDVVPVLYRGPFSEEIVHTVLGELAGKGSVAAPGFLNPEGIIVFHEAAKSLFKVALEKDSMPKGVS